MNINSDLRAKFGEIRDQGARPTCLAMAGSDLHGWHHGMSEWLSAEYLFYHAVKRTTPFDPTRAVSTAAIAASMDESGQPKETIWPYLSALPANINEWSPPQTADQLWRANIEFGKETVSGLLKTINDGNPVLMALSLSKGFFRPDVGGLIRSTKHDEDTPYHHAVVGVATGTPDGNEPFVLIRNSWGKGWGLAGYAWISAEYLEGHLLLKGSIKGTATHDTD